MAQSIAIAKMSLHWVYFSGCQKQFSQLVVELQHWVQELNFTQKYLYAKVVWMSGYKAKVASDLF